jgi:acyl-CoA reductase-like NAD-dependent aldehyde dehydrogenase
MKMKVINPATEETIRELEVDSADSVRRKVAAAREAQPAWAKLPLSHRLGVVKSFRDSLVQKTEELAKTLTLEMGKPISQSRNELKGVLGRIDYFLDHSERALKDEIVWNDAAQKMEERISHEPLGVIANISAWNYPYFVGTNVFLPALIAGNSVVYKPSEFASLSGAHIASLLHGAGVPREVFVPLYGDGTVGAALLTEKINGVYFTGSYRTGMKVAEAAARSLAKVQLELGGKDPVYVCEDVDIPAAAEGIADGAFYNAGQSCCSVERIYVHKKVFEQFVAHFVKVVGAFVVGDPLDDKTYIGPLARQAQLGVLEMQIQDAKAKGAKLLCGGKKMDRKGYFFEPTVLSHTSHAMEVMREESFGPIIGIQCVENDEEALALLNDTAYGLTAGVYTRDEVRAHALLERVNAGSAYWNCCDRVSPRLPWSGRQNSGLGSTLSIAGIQTFVQPKGWHLRKS